MEFLLFFDKLRDDKFTVPEMDNFSEAMYKSTTGSEPWLPFGLQIMIDLQPATPNEFQCRDVWSDITQDAVKLSMWKVDIKPDYMS